MEGTSKNGRSEICMYVRYKPDRYEVMSGTSYAIHNPRSLDFKVESVDANPISDRRASAAPETYILC